MCLMLWWWFCCARCLIDFELCGLPDTLLPVNRVLLVGSLQSFLTSAFPEIEQDEVVGCSLWEVL